MSVVISSQTVSSWYHGAISCTEFKMKTCDSKRNRDFPNRRFNFDPLFHFCPYFFIFVPTLSVTYWSEIKSKPFQIEEIRN